MKCFSYLFIDLCCYLFDNTVIEEVFNEVVNYKLLKNICSNFSAATGKFVSLFVAFIGVIPTFAIFPVVTVHFAPTFTAVDKSG